MAAFSIAEELTKDAILRDECFWTEDFKGWHLRYFVLRKSQIGGFEVVHFKDAAMSTMAGMLVTLDVKESLIKEFEDHPFTLTFETRRGRLFGFSFRDRDLLVHVGTLLKLQIPGLRSGVTSEDPKKSLGKVLQKSVSAREFSVNTGKVSNPNPCPKPLRKKTSLGSMARDIPGIAEKPVATEIRDGPRTSLFRLPSLGDSPPKVTRRSSTKALPERHPSTASGRISSSSSILSIEHKGCTHNTLFNLDDITLELSETECLLTVIGENNDRFQEEILPYLDALPAKLGVYSTEVKFAQLAEVFIQRAWDLTTCNIFKEGAVRCSFTTRWGEKILERLKYLDDNSRKKELMECLAVLRLSLDLNVMSNSP